MPPADANGIPDLSTALELAVPDARGELRRLKDFHGHNVVVYFYPKDDTPGARSRARNFATVSNNSRRWIASWSASAPIRPSVIARSRKSMRFPSSCWPMKTASSPTAFGVLNGKYAARSTFVLDSDLRVRRAFHEVTPRGHAAQVLNFMRTLVESHRMIGG